MKLVLLTLLTICIGVSSFAQKKEEAYDYFFKPTTTMPYYLVTTEKKDTLWHRVAFYIKERSAAMEGWYKDESATIADGKEYWFHTNKTLKSEGSYINGKKEGIWMQYDDKGNLIDSANYSSGRLKGVRMKWHSNGMASDSIQFDGAGNGVQVRWFDDGNVESAGLWTADTIKQGRWTYYFRTGKVMATEDYVNGKKVAMKCYDEEGKELADCEEKEASPSGGNEGWRRFLEQNLRPDIIAKNGVPMGQYKIIVRFIVDKDGTLSDITPLTKYGYGLEDEVLRIMKKSPKWVPAQQYGRPVRSYHTQPITMSFSSN